MKAGPLEGPFAALPLRRRTPSATGRARSACLSMIVCAGLGLCLCAWPEIGRAGPAPCDTAPFDIPTLIVTDYFGPNRADLWFRHAHCGVHQPIYDEWAAEGWGLYTYCTGANQPKCNGYWPGLWAHFLTVDPRKDNSCPVGNPIFPATGVKKQREADYEGASLAFVRTHVSFPSMGGVVFGNGWYTPYHSATIGVVQMAGKPDLAQAQRGDGRAYSFVSSGTSWAPDADLNDRLIELKDGQGNRIGWTYVESATDNVESYDATGRLLSITTRTGKTMNLAYVGNTLSTVTDAFGRSLSFAYSNGRIATMTDTVGGPYDYQYDANGNLASVTYPPDTFGVRRTRLYHYENATLFEQLTGITDENGWRFATFVYDTQGRATETKHHAAAGVDVDRFTVSFPVPYQSSTVTDPLGMQRTLSFQTTLRVPRNTGSNSAGLSCGDLPKAATFDGNGNVSSRTDFNNKKVCNAYDLTRNLETARAEGILSTETCSTVLATLPARADVRKVSTQWHAIWRLPIKVAEPNRMTTNAYNGDGGVYCAPTTALVNGNPIGVLCKKTVQETTDATGQQGLAATVTGTPRVWQYTYDSFGQVLTATDPNSKTTTTVYYAANDPDLGKRGNVYTITNPLGHVTTFIAYDLNGRPTSITDPNNVVTTLTYWPRGWLHTRSVAGETTTYDYDGVGQLTTITQPDSSYLQYTYDGAHRLTQIQDGLGNKIAYTLDAMGNRVKEEARDPGGTLARVRQQVYDSLNRLHQSVGAQ
jgi:YD repeat-containing protein